MDQNFKPGDVDMVDFFFCTGLIVRSVITLHICVETKANFMRNGHILCLDTERLLLAWMCVEMAQIYSSP